MFFFCNLLQKLLPICLIYSDSQIRLISSFSFSSFYHTTPRKNDTNLKKNRLAQQPTIFALIVFESKILTQKFSMW